MILRLSQRTVSFARRPLVMGIVNINDDSFSGDGTLDSEVALEMAAAQVAEGADIIDVGAESARPNRPAVSEAEEIARLRPFMAGYSNMVTSVGGGGGDQVWPPVLSVNTWRPGVVAAALEMGAEFINDMGALPDAENARLCAGAGAGLLIMHSVGAPKENHRDQRYGDVIREVGDFFRQKIALAVSAGLTEESIVLDPGIDFAKRPEDDLEIYRRLEEFGVFGRPLLLPVSRKSVIGHVLGRPEAVERDAGTVACIVAGMRRGAKIFRVHNVRAAVGSIKVAHAVMAPAGSG